MGPTRVTAAVPTPSHPLHFSSLFNQLAKAMRTKPRLLLFTAIALGASIGCSHKGPHSVTLKWQPPQGVSIKSFNIYRSTSTDGNFVQLATGVPAPPYEDNLVTSGRIYYYVVTTVDQSGRESRFSEQTKAIIP